MVAESARVDATLANVRAAVKHDLLAAAGTFDHPEDAIRLLWELVRKHGASDAVDNRAIDPLVFGPQAETLIKGARDAEDRGDYMLREQLRAAAVEVAIVTGCGGGACGIEKVDESSAEGSEAASLVDMKPGDTLVRDKQRSCAKCGMVGKVYYAYNTSKVNKGCLHCKATEIKGKQRQPA
jgi:hypothetical protein